MAGELIPWIELRFLNADGTEPNALGTVETYVAGTSDPAVTYAQADLDPGSANPTTITLDADGRPPDPIFLAAHGYKFIVKNALAATLYTIDEVENVGQVFAATYGVLSTEGSKNVVSGYEVDPETDRFVTVDSTGGADPCIIIMPAATDCPKPVTIKNLGTEPLAVTPDGAETIDGIAAAYAVPAAVSPLFPTVTLVALSGGTGYLIQSGLGI